MITIDVNNYITYKPPTNICKWSSLKRSLYASYTLQYKPSFDQKRRS